MRFNEGTRTERAENPGEVYESEGKWFMRFDEKTEGVEIPEDIARVIKLGLWAERRDRKNLKTSAALRVINCLQTVLHALGFIEPGDKSIKQHFNFALFPDSSYKQFNSKEDIASYVRDSIAGTLGVVQIAAPDHPSHLSHSFIAREDKAGRVVCFEKKGYGRPFQVVPLDKIIDSQSWHLRSYWVAGPIDTVKEESDVAKSAGQYFFKSSHSTE